MEKPNEKLDQRIQLVASKQFNELVDAWRRTQPDLPSRSEAIRRLVQQGLDFEESHPMRMISAIIRPARYEAVREALMELGVTGLTLTEVKGFGRQRGKTEIYRGSEYTVVETPKLRIDVVVPAERLEEVTSVIADTARTGKVGDGMLFVAPLIGVQRIRTGEVDGQAIE
ncbi:MAG: P-II family nitrogen regulator [Pseudomonadota bacterium]